MTRSEWCALSSWLGWTEVSEARLDRVAAGWTSEDWLGLSRDWERHRPGTEPPATRPA